jgi:uncharacterized circularly permuted ATP-grasp superfamily protein/uncharacterized alpha-E superfamily protein
MAEAHGRPPVFLSQTSVSQTSIQFDDNQPAAVALRRCLPARPGHYDELRDDGGALRPHWERFFGHLGGGGLADLNQRVDALARRVRDQGVTYNVYDDAHGRIRPWALDLFPFLIEPDDWDVLERGVAQRAQLLSWMMRDVYGAQTLLRDGLLPPALVHGSPGYLRAMAGGSGASHDLLIVACDVARAPDGRWFVVTQRAQAPSGLGYALQNRLIVSRLFPDAFRELSVQRLASSYLRLLETMRRLAPRDPGESGPARIALLTPGPFNETYFEHAFLARYLGVPLVEGNDLMVRDERLYLKSMHGRERIHALIRRLDDGYCDPLELRPDSALGVPGLLQAVRAGRLMVANPIGSAFLESPAINGFLPAISRRALGTELLLPSLDSWWCGEDVAREQSIDMLSQAVIKSTHGAGFDLPPLGPQLSPVQLADARRRIEGDPEAFTLQSYVQLSQTPTWSRGLVAPRGSMIRLFAIGDADGNWQTMPGGLTRIAGEQELVAMQRGGSSADTWIMTRGAVDRVSLLPGRLGQREIADKRRPVSSRAAENLFWLGRYTERTENAVRFSRQILARLHDEEPAPDPVLTAVARVAIGHRLVPEAVPSPVQSPRLFERTLLAGLAHRDPSSSVSFNLDALSRAAGEIRERLAQDQWRLISGAGAAFARTLRALRGDGELSADAAQFALLAATDRLAAITGAQQDRMTRDDGWRMLALGRQIERLIAMSEALRIVLGTGALRYPAGFHLTLELFDSTITYRALYPGLEQAAALIDLVVLDPSNPRSMACVGATLQQLIRELPARDGGANQDLLKLLAAAGLDERLGELCEPGDDGTYRALEALLARLTAGAMKLSDALGMRFFSHADRPQQAISG